VACLNELLNVYYLEIWKEYRNINRSYVWLLAYCV